jgi:hypothetical protein
VVVGPSSLVVNAQPAAPTAIHGTLFCWLNLMHPLPAWPGAGGTALSMNWGDVGKKDFSKQGKEGEEEEDFGRARG